MTRWSVAGGLRCVLLAGCALLLPASALCQTTVDGSAEWTAVSNASRSNAQSSDNSAFWQNYTVGYSSSLWDPRLVRFNTQALARTTKLYSGGAAQPDAHGHQGDLGYRLGASLLSSSVMPFVIQTSRTTSSSTGELGPSNPVRSGMIAPTGAPPVDFESRVNTLSLGWQLGLARFPRADFNYRRGRSTITGGSYEAQQRDGDLSTSLTKATTRTRHSVRFQRTSFENQVAETFAQRLSNLDYDLTTFLTTHTRLTAHAGRRATYARSEFASPAVADAGAYLPPATLGSSEAASAQAGVAYDPNARVSLRVNGSLDRQTGGTASTGAALVNVATNVEVVPGLTVTGSSTSGNRGQFAGSTPITVSTRAAAAGATYQRRVRWVTGSVSGTRGLGSSGTPEGRRGSSSSSSKEGSLWATFTWFAVGAGADTSANHDDLLDFGNYNGRRLHTSLQTGTSRVSLSSSVESLHVERGLAATLATNAQRTLSTTASIRVQRESIVTLTAGGFVNHYGGVAGMGTDRTGFWGAGIQSTWRSRLRTAAWIRREGANASRTSFDQSSVNTFGRLEYRLRTISMALEYRSNGGRMQYVGAPKADDYRGRQVRFSLSRQFGMRLR